jgi:hypothetical protein
VKAFFENKKQVNCTLLLHVSDANLGPWCSRQKASYIKLWRQQDEIMTLIRSMPKNSAAIMGRTHQNQRNEETGPLVSICVLSCREDGFAGIKNCSCKIKYKKLDILKESNGSA